MTEDIHVAVGHATVGVREITKSDPPEVRKPEFDKLVGQVNQQATQIGTHVTQIGNVEKRLDGLSEWMGAIKEWVPQQTGGIAAQVHEHEERIKKLETAPKTIVPTFTREVKPDEPVQTSVMPVPKDAKQAEKDWVHYFGGQVQNLQSSFHDLEERFHVHSATVRDQVISHTQQPHYAPKSRLPLWLTIGLTFSTQIVHLLHYLTHLH